MKKSSQALRTLLYSSRVNNKITSEREKFNDSEDISKNGNNFRGNNFTKQSESLRDSEEITKKTEISSVKENNLEVIFSEINSSVI